MRLLVLHQCSSEYLHLDNSATGLLPFLPGPVIGESLLGDSSLTSLSDGTRNQFTKLLLLEFLQRSLCWSNEFLQETLEQESCIRPRGPPTTYDYWDDNQSIVEGVQDLTDSIEYVASSLITGIPVVPYSSAKSSRLAERTAELRSEYTSCLSAKSLCLTERITELRGECTRLNRLATRLIGRQERDYNLFLSTLNIHESQSVKRLTILAAIFLPLNLASGILGMQTRFAKLQWLLYDFLGVVILLGQVAILAYIILKVSTKLPNWPRLIGDVRGNPWDKYILGVILWSVVVGSFIVGMLINPKLGSKVLAIGLGSSASTYVVFVRYYSAASSLVLELLEIWSTSVAVAVAVAVVEHWWWWLRRHTRWRPPTEASGSTICRPSRP
jgi:hypothetical protein